MRINIELPSYSAAASTSSQRNLVNAPPTLAKLTPSGELVLIELQGSLEIDDAHPEGGQILGKLEFHKDREDRPTLLISHHRLEGKVVALTKPFAVLQKRKKNSGPTKGALDEKTRKRSAVREESREERVNGNEDDLITAREHLNSSPTRFGLQQNEMGEYGDENEDVEYIDEEDGSASPSVARKRAKIPDAGNGYPHKLAKSSERKIVTSSSSPAPKVPLRGSELDFSSPIARSRTAPSFLPRRAEEDEEGERQAINEVDNDEDAELDWLHKRDTTTTFDVVCLIRKKILFTKRPEPVVRLDGEGGEKARIALGLA
ncbi:hypothetical protein CBS101457_004015 [Exobasidium rhododendri]|nr:hypothetical protein CBS101457_004015 [Exobasidium rhododendri]